MDDINTNQNNQQLPETTPTPEASGDQGEKLFTQADLDRIIGERLSRERQKAEPSPVEAREAELKAREARMDCREFIVEGGYPLELLDILDPSDSEKFKTAVEKLDSLVGLPSKHREPAPRIVAPLGGGHSAPRRPDAALLEQAFAPPKI